MIYLATNHASVPAWRAKGLPLGWMLSTSAGWRTPTVPFALDNGMYHHPDEPPRGMKYLPMFYTMVDRCRAEGHAPLFIAVPDVPYNMARSRELSRTHLRHLRGPACLLRRCLCRARNLSPCRPGQLRRAPHRLSRRWRGRGHERGNAVSFPSPELKLALAAVLAQYGSPRLWLPLPAAGSSYLPICPGDEWPWRIGCTRREDLLMVPVTDKQWEYLIRMIQPQSRQMNNEYRRAGASETMLDELYSALHEWSERYWGAHA